MAEAEFCRTLAIDEPMIGTAHAEATRWIVLEDGRAWGAKVPKQTTLPDPVKTWLDDVGGQPGTRVQLMRQPGSALRGQTRRLVLARTPLDPASRRYVELDVELDALPELDIDALLDRAEPAGVGTQLWLVCTHGARDRCCAKWGVAIWDALRTLAGPDRVWQCSHIGGHRFAPTMLALPTALVWGRLEHAELAPIVTAAAQGRIAALAKLRGRSSHTTVVQAAECLVRLRDGIVEDDLRVLEQVDVGQGRTLVRFAAPAGGVEIVVEQELLSLATAASCGDPLEPRRAWTVSA